MGLSLRVLVLSQARVFLVPSENAAQATSLHRSGLTGELPLVAVWSRFF